MGHLIGHIRHLRLAEGEFKWGGGITPTLTCSTEIYVYEVIYDSSNEGKES